MWYQTSFISFSILYPILTCHKIKVTLKNDKMGFKKLIKMGMIFYILWLISNYFAILALKNISSSLMVAVFSVSPAFVYILSFIVLKDELNWIKTSAVVSAVLGVIFIGISQKILDGNVVGIFYAMFSALFSAFYIVFLKKLIGTTTVATATILLGIIGLINTVMFWPVFLILDHFEIETIDWNQIPWGYLNISAVTGFFFNAFVNIGIAFTYPLFISIGTILGIPANIFVDWVIHGLIITPLQLVGSFFVIVAFCLLVFSGMIGLKKEKEDESMELMLSEEINKEKKILDSDMNHNIKSHHTI
jgi:solute carrier family 35 protein F3/4